MNSKAKAEIKAFMEGLIDLPSNKVRFDSLARTHDYLTRNGFKLMWADDNYGQKGRWQLFYESGAFASAMKGMTVRVKTHGELNGPRANKPHLSVGWTEGIWTEDDTQQTLPSGATITNLQGLPAFENEKNKFNTSGDKEGKLPPPGSDKSTADAWANRTHFNFPIEQPLTGAEAIVGKPASNA